MRRSRRPIVITSRRSLLARAQAEAVGRTLARLHPQVDVKYRWIESAGDQQIAASLADVGGKGLFITAVEEALLRGDADLAVHSLKDMPTELTGGLSIAAIPRRGDVRDCLIAPAATTLEELAPGARVGTSSPRRAGQLLRCRPDLVVEPIRGNIDTRLRKVLQDHQYEATLLAVAGLQRAGLGGHARAPLAVDRMLPAAGQAALAIQCRTDDHVTLSRCLPVNDPTTSTAVYAERQLVALLAGNCHSAIAVYAQPLDAQRLRIRARVLTPDGRHCLESEAEGVARELSRLVRQMAEDLKDRGAGQLLDGSASKRA